MREIFGDNSMRLLLLTAVVSLTIAGHARAEFVVKTAQPERAAPAVAQTVTTSDAAVPSTDSAAQPIKPRFKMAYGFGSNVPLAFACRQIVPRAVKVTYGPGADGAALVSWKGGDTWNHVLRDAVQPLGLHLVMTTMAVEIRR